MPTRSESAVFVNSKEFSLFHPAVEFEGALFYF